MELTGELVINQNDKTFSDSYSRYNEGNSNEWLNLFLGRNCITDMEQGSKSEFTSKAFSCNFCSSQAMGGHQSAHKRERGAIKRYQCERHLAMISLLASKPIFQSLGAQPHSLAQKTCREWGPMLARFNYVTKGFGMTQTAIVPVEATSAEWPGSFCTVSELIQPSELLNIDLTLRL